MKDTGVVKIVNRLVSKVKRYLKCPYKIEKKIPCVCIGEVSTSFGVALDYIKKDMKVLSFGVGEDVSFDQALVNDHGAEIYAFDPTPRSIAWVRSQGIENEHFHFFPIGLARENGKAAFHLPVNDAYVSGSLVAHKGVQSEVVEVEMYDFSSIYEKIDLKGDIDILKMDIEGTEFDVLPDILTFSRENNIDIYQICIEWHGRFYRHGRAKVKKMCGLLKEYGYSLVYICEEAECTTFVKDKDRS